MVRVSPVLKGLELEGKDPLTVQPSSASAGDLGLRLGDSSDLRVG